MVMESNEIRHKKDDILNVEEVEEKTLTEGLCHPRPLLYLSLWYIFSAFTLFINKHILSTLKGDPTLLGTCQMTITTLLGLFQMYFPLGMYVPVKRHGKPPNFWRNMLIVGTTRFLTVFLGLVALKFVAVSFTETVKSSAPLFTVFISQAIIGEKTGIFVQLSLIPIMGGLALCSANEISFNLPGFISALGANLSECVQNVYSKMLICSEQFKYTPAELQFYTALSSIVVQIPSCVLIMDVHQAYKTLNSEMFIALLLNGICFHFQTITAYVLMGYISNVTHAVANTVKRAFLIWSSVLIFGNPVTILSGLGTVIVTGGVLLYNKARDYDARRNQALKPRVGINNVKLEGDLIKT